MKLSANVDKSLTKGINKVQTLLGNAVRSGISETTSGLKDNLRQQIIRAGMGTRLANTWRSKVYPDKSSSLDAAGFVYSNAPNIIESFDKGVVIKAHNKQCLAIPTPAAPKRGTDGKRINPYNFPVAKLGKLILIKRRSGPWFLVVENVRASFSRKTGQMRGYVKGSASAIRTGRNLSSAIMFILIPQVQMPKRFDVASTGELWASRAPDIIDKYLVDDKS